ncbi:hypothetical protein FRB95_002291 [Tulasnella sp. JGI-2019a]|nr:hypothetical protein FRB95_002291 [Tulasnella sp. JGI-2019a]
MNSLLGCARGGNLNGNDGGGGIVLRSQQQIYIGIISIIICHLLPVSHGVFPRLFHNQFTEELTTLVLNVPWLVRIKSLILENAYIPEDLLLRMLRRISLLKDLTFGTWEIICRTTKALSRKTKRSGWLCPLLEEFTLTSGFNLLKSDVMAIVRARAFDAPGGTMEPNLLRPVRLLKVVWGSRDMVQVAPSTNEMQT